MSEPVGPRPLRAPALALALLAACASSPRRGGTGTAAEDEPLRMTVEASEDGGVALRVQNATARPVVVQRALQIEAVEVFGTAYSSRELAGFGVSDELFLIEECGQPTGGCVQIEPGEPLRAVPWTGTYAVPQCDRDAPSDYPAPPGRYRFVVTACSGGARFRSEPFARGAPPP